MIFQVSAAMLDACVLAILTHEDKYGYKLTQEIKEKLGISESTLYPVLRRLQKEAFLETYDVAVTGRNRRYYRLTQRGREKVMDYREEWLKFTNRIGTILMEGTENE